MRKLLYLGFCLVLAAGVGCALTDYCLITDNDQLKQGAGNATVNTNGKAHVRTAQKATLWGTSNDELLMFVDQKSNGERTMTNYNNFSTSFVDPTFHDDLYCNPDWQGCSMWTATDPPGSYFCDFGGPAYDGVYNGNCSGSRSLALLVASRRGGFYNYGECGRGGKLDRALALMNMGQKANKFGVDGLNYHLDRNNFTATVNGQLLPVFEANIFADVIGNRMYADWSHPLTPLSLRAVDDIMPNQGQMSISVTYNGVNFQRNVFKWADVKKFADMNF